MPPTAEAGYPAMQAQAVGTPAGMPYVSERGENVLALLETQGQVGPSDLARVYGSSAPTWSRELDQLTNAGLIKKYGQKRVLTELGRAWIQAKHGTA